MWTRTPQTHSALCADRDGGGGGVGNMNRVVSEFFIDSGVAIVPKKALSSDCTGAIVQPNKMRQSSVPLVEKNIVSVETIPVKASSRLSLSEAPASLHGSPAFGTLGTMTGRPGTV